MANIEIIKANSINEARRMIDRAFEQKLKVVVIAKNDDFNRKILENNKVDVLIVSELKGKDRLKQRNSGLNQVLCKLAKQNNIDIGIDFSEIKKKKDFELSEYLAKIMQNIKLCNKYKVGMVLINTKNDNKIDLKAFLSTLGMPTSMTKYVIDNNSNL